MFLEANFLHTGRCVEKTLDEAAQKRGWPKAITVNNVAEFVPNMRDELIRVQDAREKSKAWRHDHNHHRPHGFRGHLTSSKFARKRLNQPLDSCCCSSLEVTGYEGDLGHDDCS